MLVAPRGMPTAAAICGTVATKGTGAGVGGGGGGGVGGGVAGGGGGVAGAGGLVTAAGDGGGAHLMTIGFAVGPAGAGVGTTATDAVTTKAPLTTGQVMVHEA